ncbi:putative cytochrome p450 monooxygenase protein [Botrytis cinerea BcDW1]|uniref:Putative cytochrome p450 monooxygenase protein n=1 Tax=Botryotinia fuckeliana (strain BcDW1) TaxID=1290391 RepID=M7TH78_BOTF1|nr:putative cytochrome p450 monooxygenase protein [Botrytis cinerea BcDW1]
MDRVIVSRKFMKDFNALPRKQVRLTASVRHAGPYTGFDIAEESDLQFLVCAGQLSQNIGRLAQPTYDEILFRINSKLEKTGSKDGNYSFPLFGLAIELITSASARAFVGPELCRDPEWLATATGYTIEFLHPVIAPFLKSYKQIRNRFSVARKLLLPLIRERRSTSAKEHPDMVQWLIDSARGSDAETDKLVTRMLFLNAAAIHTTAEVATNAILDLCARPEDVKTLKKELTMVNEEAEGVDISVRTLSSLKMMDSFIKESHRVNTLGLMTFNRQLAIPVTLSNGVTLPKDTYISMTHYLINKDPELYLSPNTFDPLRFYKQRQELGQQERYQFSSLSSENPSWGVGKFACPGCFWASAQIKLLLMVLLNEFEISYPEGQTERPQNVVKGEKNQVSLGQRIVLRRKE